MKKNKIIISLITLVFFTLNSCSDYLETKPRSFWTDKTFYSNKQEVDLALAGIYSQLSNDQVYGWSLNVLIEAGTDESYTNDGTANWAEANNEHSSASDPIKNVWLKFYSCIQLVNQLESKLSPDIFVSTGNNTAENQYKEVLAKAYFMRAFCYFNLANWFGPVPLRLTPSLSQEDNNLAPSPAFDVYTQVEKDLIFASENLVNSKSGRYTPGEPNKMAAHGLLARLYLRMGGYQPYLSDVDANCYFENSQQYFVKAKQQCEIVMNDSYYGIVPYSTDPLSYRTHFLNYLQDRYDLKESLFEISFGYYEQLGLRVSGRLGNLNGVEFVGRNDIPRGFCKINASVSLYNSYDLQDKRREWNIAGYKNRVSASAGSVVVTSYIYDNPLDEEYGPGKFRRWEPTDLAAVKASGTLQRAPYTILNNTVGSDTDPNFTSINFPILRYSDILLMHAEACIGGKNGTADADINAVKSLNIVRERAGLAPYDGSLSHNQFFNELVDERLRELCFEGLRKQDLIRWNLLGEKLEESNAAVRNFPRYDASLQPHNTYQLAGRNFDKKKHLQLPYPEQEVLINGKLEQKNEWKR